MSNVVDTQEDKSILYYGGHFVSPASSALIGGNGSGNVTPQRWRRRPEGVKKWRNKYHRQRVLISGVTPREGLLRCDRSSFSSSYRDGFSEGWSGILEVGCGIFMATPLWRDANKCQKRSDASSFRPQKSPNKLRKAKKKSLLQAILPINYSLFERSIRSVPSRSRSRPPSGQELFISIYSIIYSSPLFRRLFWRGAPK